MPTFADTGRRRGTYTFSDDLNEVRLVMARGVRFILKVLEHVINGLANGLPDDALSCRLRGVMYGFLGNRISTHATLFGGGRVCGRRLVVEDGVFVNRGCYFDLSDDVQLKRGCTIGHGVTFVTANHRIGPPSKRAGAVYSAKVTIGAGAWIGANATILPGVEVGEGSVVGAGALVTKNVPANCLVTGIPARISKSSEDS